MQRGDASRRLHLNHRSSRRRHGLQRNLPAENFSLRILRDKRQIVRPLLPIDRLNLRARRMSGGRIGSLPVKFNERYAGLRRQIDSDRHFGANGIALHSRLSVEAQITQEKRFRHAHKSGQFRDFAACGAHFNSDGVDARRLEYVTDSPQILPALIRSVIERPRHLFQRLLCIDAEDRSESVQGP